jgi:hypothetical protein
MPYTDIAKRNKFFRDRYAANISYVSALKLASGCVDCGYNEHVAALEFDHIMPRLRGTVASQMGKSLNVIKQEIERCEIVCANCHNIRTHDRRSR